MYSLDTTFTEGLLSPGVGDVISPSGDADMTNIEYHDDDAAALIVITLIKSNTPSVSQDNAAENMPHQHGASENGSSGEGQRSGTGSEGKSHIIASDLASIGHGGMCLNGRWYEY